MHTITVGDIDIEIERKPIKNMHLAVYPPDARVHISMPDYLADDDARSFVLQKIDWLRASIGEVLTQPRQSERCYVSGESHYLFGRRYQLIVDESPRGHGSIELKGNRMHMSVAPGTSVEAKAEMMRGWYRAHLKKELAPKLEFWAERLGVAGFDWQVKRMKTEWGSCVMSKRLLIFSLQLARVPLECIEFVIVHELTHLAVPNHGPAFEALMTRRLPAWRTLRDKLNSFEALPYE